MCCTPGFIYEVKASFPKSTALHPALPNKGRLEAKDIHLDYP